MVAQLTPDLTSWVVTYAERLDVVETKLTEQTKRGDDLERRVNHLEKQMKRTVINARKRDVAIVRNNIITPPPSQTPFDLIFLEAMKEIEFSV